jgi:type VI secretion system secreted protein Hcp
MKLNLISKTMATIALLIVSSLTFAAPTRMFIKTTGMKQGIFRGEALVKGKETFAEIKSFSFEEMAPRDPSSGMPTGKRILKPIVINKNFGNSSTQYLSALSTSEILKEVRIEFYAQSPRDGQEVLDHAIVLLDAGVADYKDNIFLEDKGYVDQEEINLVYRRIQYLDRNGAVVFEDIIDQRG